MRKTLLAIGLMFGTLSGFGQEKVEYTEFDLDNGLHVILHEDNSTPIVAVTMMYHVGSKNEDTNRTGFAHFFEHLLFEGSENIERGQYDKYVENAGGTLNANTSNDRTFYYELLPSNELELGLWLESERLLHARVENVGIETQREVVKEEKRQRIDNQPYASFIKELFERAYSVHPYRWPVIGSMAHIDAAQEQDYQKFYNTFYTPQNAVLSIAGDINVDSTKAMIEKYFAGIPTGEALMAYRDFERMSAEDFYTKYASTLGGNKDEVVAKLSEMNADAMIAAYFPKQEKVKVPQPTIVEPPLAGEIMDTIYDNITLPGVMMGYRIPEQTADDYYALDVLNRYVSGGNSSLFQTVIVDEKQMALYSGSFPFGLEDPGMMIAMAIINQGVDPTEVLNEMTNVIEGVQDTLISEKDLQKVRNQIENDFYSQNSSIAGVAEQLAQYYMYYGNTELINTEIEKYMAVTAEDIQRVAKKYFNKNNRVVLFYLPQPQEQ